MKRHRRICEAALIGGVWLVRWPLAHAQPADAPAVEQRGVSDPMLAPPEAAPAELRSWDEAIAMMRRSPSYLTSAAEVERALAQRRIALAAVLPTLTGSAGYLHNFANVNIASGGSVLVAPPPTGWSASATASWDIVNPPRVHRIRAADLANPV